MRLASFPVVDRIVACSRTVRRPDSLSRLAIALGVLVIVRLMVCANAMLCAEEEAFPYKAFVAQDRTRLLSGPADDHYATDELRRGDEVEVYRRVEGGWLAVRPPQSSFSWVSQRDVQLTDQPDLGEVVGTAAISWIGSGVDKVADHRWLIKLERGETIVVLGRERRRMLATGKSDVYYKIAPPSGEFRWIHEDELVREKAEITSIKDPNVQLADFRVALRGKARPEPKPDKETSSKPVEPADTAKKDGFSPRDKSPIASTRTGGLALIPKRGVKSPAANRDSTLEKLEKGVSLDLDSRIRELDAQLSLMAAQPAESWDFAALRVAAEQLATDGQSTLDRARVQLYLDKLSEFEGLKSRYALMAPKPPITGPLPKLSVSGSLDAAGNPRFDGTGWLLPVHSSKKSSPPFALLDKEGNILQFVSPAPGLNLNRYLRKEIGVFGQKDQPTTLDKPHLTAHRIVELDRHRK